MADGDVVDFLLASTHQSPRDVLPHEGRRFASVL
jgi:hypothetical protein